MTTPDATCWTLIRDAAEGDAAARERFARVYRPVAVAALAGRWKASPRFHWIEDATQDVFVECFKSGGVLESANRDQGGFRSFFLAVVRNVARRHEEKHRVAVPWPSDPVASDTSLSVAFDRAWAKSLLQEAARLQAEIATGDERATQRVNLLRLRFQEGLAIREIAVKWRQDPAWLHHEYAAARDEFRLALRRVVAFHWPTATDDELTAAGQELLDVLK
jgi:RNA polymerase sigma-70 factor (ECF subfamily)